MALRILGLRVLSTVPFKASLRLLSARSASIGTWVWVSGLLDKDSANTSLPMKHFKRM